MKNYLECKYNTNWSVCMIHSYVHEHIIESIILLNGIDTK